jgi:hypothetical protein
VLREPASKNVVMIEIPETDHHAVTTADQPVDAGRRGRLSVRFDTDLGRITSFGPSDRVCRQAITGRSAFSGHTQRRHEWATALGSRATTLPVGRLARWAVMVADIER